MKENTAVKEIFIIRLWRDTADPLVWRGEVQRVRTGEAVYIRSAGELLDYLQQQMQSSEERLPSSSESGLR